MEIRHLTPAEIPQGLELVRDVFLEFEAPDYPPEGVEEFFRFLDDPQQASLCFYGAWDGTVLRGVLAARKEHICLLFVRREYHRQGTARALIEAYCRPGQSQSIPRPMRWRPITVWDSGIQRPSRQSMESLLRP